MTEPQPVARLDLGRVASRTFGSIGANFLIFFLLVVLLSALPTLLAGLGLGLAMTWLMTVADLSSPLMTFLPLLLLFLAGIPGYIALGAITHGAIVFFNGGKASFGACIATGVRLLLPMLGLAILTYFGLLLYAFLLFVPAIMAMTRWAVAGPALVVEHIGILDAFRRSADLTRDSRWRIFWLSLIYGVVVLLIQSAITFLSQRLTLGIDGGLSYTGVWIRFGVTLLYSTLNAMIGAAGVAALYFEQRTMKEGATSDELAKVFE
jgi:hypothetical protein